MCTQNSCGFTAAELLVAAVLVVIIAAFAIPSYQRSSDRSQEKAAVRGLMLIREGLHIYYARNGAWVDRDMTTVDDINTTLSIYLIAKDVSYGCTGTTTSYECTATSDAGWQVQIRNTVNNGAPYCVDTQCPQCTGSACPYSL